VVGEQVTRFDDALCKFRLELRSDTAAQPETLDVFLEIDETQHLDDP
jgi:hypothetical protein